VGRATQGVRIMRVDEGEVVSSVERLAEPDDESIEEAAPVEASEVEAAAAEAVLEDEGEGDVADDDAGEGEDEK
jgi:DNA gyrase subunit A